MLSSPSGLAASPCSFELLCTHFYSFVTGTLKVINLTWFAWEWCNPNNVESSDWKPLFARLCWVTTALRSVKHLKCALTLGKTGINKENKVILVTQLQLQSLAWHVAEFLGRQGVYQWCTSAETPGYIWYWTEIILTSSAVLSKQTCFTNFSLIRFWSKIILASVKLE